MKKLKFSNFKHSKPKFALPKRSRQGFVQHANRRIRHGMSISETRWIQKLGVPIPSQVIRLPNGKYWVVDGYDPKTNTIYEYLGSFFHADPRLYNPDKYNTFLKKYNRELYFGTIERLKTLHNLNYKVFFVWELDDKKGKIGRYYYYYDKTTNTWDNLL